MRFLFSSLYLLLLTIHVGGQMDNSTADCGRSNHPAHENFFQTLLHSLQDKLSRIIGGSDSPVGKWPWQVYLILTNPNFKMTCGGSIIADRWILTAAHCFPVKMDVTVIFGSVKPEAQENKTINGKIVTVHEQWSQINNYHNDIALIELEEPINFDATASPVCLPTMNTTIPKRAGVIATGFGREYNKSTWEVFTPQNLLETTFPLVPLDVCSKLWKGGLEDDQPLYDTQICGGSLGHGTAPGDSGGPLVINSESGRWFQIGLTSFGMNANQLLIHQEIMPGVYTNVQKYCDWIEEKTRGEAKCRDGELIDSSTNKASMPFAIMALIIYILA